MINQIVPENFTEYWALLEPLMKPEYFTDQKGKDELIQLKEQLLNVVIKRDNIGEALWYIYTAVLLISVIQYNLTTRGCRKDPQTMAESHQEFLKEEETQIAEKQKLDSQVFIG